MFAKRLIFEKLSPSIYYSHLDLMRCFERAFRRAKLPIWYTEGFNPRPFQSFAQPLSLGVTGLSEVLDIRLSEDIANDELMSRLNAALPEGVNILKIGEPAAKVSDIYAAEYTISTPGNKTLCKTLDSFLSRESIETVKLNKKKQRTTIDLKPMIFEYAVSCKGKNVVLECTLACGSEKNLNPALIFTAFAEENNLDPSSIDLEITRKALVLKNNGQFI